MVMVECRGRAAVDIRATSVCQCIRIDVPRQLVARAFLHLPDATAFERIADTEDVRARKAISCSDPSSSDGNADQRTATTGAVVGGAFLVKVLEKGLLLKV